ncbi:hypothetical protein VNI00_018606 [Paramarasmius palmivorus]|uniref:HMG domain-containing protein n=1 Tax=Paramarasmius palmivorus TaxID=297713 RepID=A0AAW0AW87_9AGAR
MGRQRLPSPVSPSLPSRLRSPDPVPQNTSRLRFDEDQDMELVSPKKRPRPKEGRRLKRSRKRQALKESPSRQGNISILPQNSVSDTVADSRVFCSPVEEPNIESPVIELAGPVDGEIIDTEGDNEADEAFERYIKMVKAGCSGFVRVGRNIHVVQGWSESRHQPVDHWYHLEAYSTEGVQITCLCPDGASRVRRCVHEQYFHEFLEEDFVKEENLWFRDGSVVMFWREMIGYNEESWLTRFSVMGLSGGLNARAVVTYEGTDDGQGKWQCSKDRNSCLHISHARKFLSDVLGKDLGKSTCQSDHDQNEQYIVEENVEYESAVSYLPILLPEWAMLASDRLHYAHPALNETPPQVFSLSIDRSSTTCKHRSKYQPGLPTVVRECKVYGLTQHYTCLIELQRCPHCPPRRHCYIGPETRDLGIFNYNNSVLFTHELIDHYSSESSTSETPFAAFVETTSRLYKARKCDFVGEDLFRSVWFAYVSIQDLDNDLKCPQCGDTPENIIFDGITLGFSRKHVTESLHPPTIIESDAPQRRRRYLKNPQWILWSEKGLRKILVAWLAAVKQGVRRLARLGDHEFVGDENGDVLSSTEYSDGRRNISTRLQKLVPPLACLFDKVFPDKWAGMAQVHPSVTLRYVTLFEQLAAEESALQMVNASALDKLTTFVTEPTPGKAWILRDIPALLKVFEAEIKHRGTFPAELLRVCVWMKARANEVLQDLKSGNLPPLPEIIHTSDKQDNWKKYFYSAEFCLGGTCSSLDVMTLILKFYINQEGSWGNAAVMRVQPDVTKNIIRLFYSDITLASYTALFSLRKTLAAKPNYIPYIKKLWVRFGFLVSQQPGVMDMNYPVQYDYDFLFRHYLSLSEMERVRELLHVLSGGLKTLTILCTREYNQLTNLLDHIVFPQLEELEAPSWVLFPSTARAMQGFNDSRWPSLQNLRVTYDMKVGSIEKLKARQDFRMFRNLKRLYLSYNLDSEHMVVHLIPHIKTVPSVDIVALEYLGGLAIPFPLLKLDTIELHPKFVFIFRAGTAEGAHWESVLDEISPTSWTYEQLIDKGVWIDTDNIRYESLWTEAEERVARRWETFRCEESH